MPPHRSTLLLWARLAGAASAGGRGPHAAVAAASTTAAVGVGGAATSTRAASASNALLHWARHASAWTASTSGREGGGSDGRRMGLPYSLALTRSASTSTTTPTSLPATTPLTYADLRSSAAAVRARKDEVKPTSIPIDPSIAACLNRFSTSPAARDAALALYVNASLFDIASASFTRLVRDAVRGGGSVAEGLRSLVAEEEEKVAAAAASTPPPPPPSSTTPPSLFPLFAAHCLAAYAPRIAAYRDVVQALDMRSPHTWHPLARSLTRRIIYHAGPTNSGKTHAALSALSAAPSGVYCGPLRLLAVEVWDELNARGVPTRLITGQEARDMPGARHTACTVEMADVGMGASVPGIEAGRAPGEVGGVIGDGDGGPHASRVAVAVIDEIQLIGDPGRGWAWTRALHGLAADEVHVCGDATALGLVAAIAADCGDAFEVRTYRRFRPLRLDTAGLPNGLADVQPGDCVVAFSRAEIYRARAALEAGTGLRAAVIYGALPPETRRSQARRFNEVGGGADVLVASDAVGMGLNLNIRRVVFAGLTKPSGALLGSQGGPAVCPSPGGLAAPRPPASSSPSSATTTRRPRPPRAPIPPPALKQIAGRAGRRSSAWPEGWATTLDPADLPSLAASLAVPTTTSDTPAAALFPELDQLEAYAGRHPGAPLAEILERAAGEARLDGRYFFAQQTSVLEAAALLEAVPGLSLRDRFLFCAAPASPRDKRSGGALVAFAAAYASGGPVLLGGGGHAALLPVPDAAGATPPISTAGGMKDAEDAHAIVSLYMWLAHRFSGAAGRFPDTSAAAEEAGRIIQLLDAGLEAVGVAGRAAAARAAARPASKKEGKRTRGSVASAAASAAAAVEEAPNTPDVSREEHRRRRLAARRAGNERAVRAVREAAGGRREAAAKAVAASASSCASLAGLPAGGGVCVAATPA